MNTIIYSVAGIIIIFGAAFLFTYLEGFRTRKWKSRINEIRKSMSDAKLNKPQGSGQPVIMQDIRFPVRETKEIIPFDLPQV